MSDPTSTEKPRELNGAQALAWGAIAAGVATVTGYPGSPTTAVFDAILAQTAPEQISAKWSPNEKVAMEIAMGASIGGSRSLVVLKSVGLNVGLDPLATFSYTGNHAGLVVLLGDDPGAWGSQNEQDSRWLARTAEVPIVEPATVAQGAQIMAQAFSWSESLGTPIIVRITRSYALDHGIVDAPWQLPAPRKPFYRKHNRWLVLPPIAIARRRSLHDRLRKISRLFDASPYDVARGSGPAGVLSVGHTAEKLQQALPSDALAEIALLSLTSAWPLPEQALSSWLGDRERVLVLEECGPFVEQNLRALAQRLGLNVAIYGRHTRDVPEEGELTASDLTSAVRCIGLDTAEQDGAMLSRSLPSKTPLCVDCPYHPVFQGLIEAMGQMGGRRRYIVVGETSCMVRANEPPYSLLDVKYSLGSGIGLATGVASSTTKHHTIGLIGDSSFFHSDLPALIHLAQMRLPVTLIILDNGSTALTGGQTHPGAIRDERGQLRPSPASIEGLVAASGIVPTVIACDDRETMLIGIRQAIQTAQDQRRPQVIVARGACPRCVEEA